MLLFPAIDLIEGKAVRLLKGAYEKMTVYSDTPAAVALDFKKQGAAAIHLVDLEGAKSGTTPNLETITAIKRQSGLFCEVGGGIFSNYNVHNHPSFTAILSQKPPPDNQFRQKLLKTPCFFACNHI